MKIKITLENEADKDDGKTVMNHLEEIVAYCDLNEDESPVTFGIIAELKEALK